MGKKLPVVTLVWQRQYSERTHRWKVILPPRKLRWVDVLGLPSTHEQIQPKPWEICANLVLSRQKQSEFYSSSIRDNPQHLNLPTWVKPSELRKKPGTCVPSTDPQPSDPWRRVPSESARSDPAGLPYRNLKHLTSRVVTINLLPHLPLNRALLRSYAHPWRFPL